MIDGAVFGAYVLVLLAIGRTQSRKIQDSDDFHLCGRQLGRVPASFSLTATELSGSGLIGGAGLAYAIGVSGAYWNLVAVPAYIVIGLTSAVALRKLALDTVPSYLGSRYGVSTRRLVAGLQVVESVVFTAVQIMVSALALSTLFGLDLAVASASVTAVFVVYTAMGGLWAVVWTDALQYVVLMGGVLVGLPLALSHVGGLDGLQAALPAERFDPGALGTMTPLAWLALCFYSYSTDQTYLQRAFASRDEDVARFAYLFTGANYVVFGICVAGMGMAATVLLPELDLQDEALPRLVNEVFPRGLRAFFLTAILATTMSTASSWLASATSLFARDLYGPLRGGLNKVEELRASRIATVAFAVAALVIARAFPGVVDAVVFSTLVAPAAVFFPLMLGLYWKRTSRRAAFPAVLAAAAVGAGSQAFLFGKVDGWIGAVHPLFLGPAVGLAVLVVGSLLWPGGGDVHRGAAPAADGTGRS